MCDTTDYLKNIEKKKQYVEKKKEELRPYINDGENARKLIYTLQDFDIFLELRDEKKDQLAGIHIGDYILLDTHNKIFTLSIEEIMNTRNSYCTSKDRALTYPRRLPHHYNSCPYCNNHWDIKNIFDRVEIGKDLYHSECAKYYLENEERTHLTELFTTAGIMKYVIGMKPIPCQYSNDYNRDPWFIVSTTYGNFTMGLRSRVYEIRFHKSFVKFKEQFEEYSVTKQFDEDKNSRYIHAYTDNDIIIYLKRIFMEITNA